MLITSYLHPVLLCSPRSTNILIVIIKIITIIAFRFQTLCNRICSIRCGRAYNVA